MMARPKARVKTYTIIAIQLTLQSASFPRDKRAGADFLLGRHPLRYKNQNILCTAWRFTDHVACPVSNSGMHYGNLNHVRRGVNAERKTGTSFVFKAHPCRFSGVGRNNRSHQIGKSWNSGQENYV